MGTKNTSGVRIEVRRGKRHRIIDFRYKDKNGRERRYRKDAAALTHSAAVAEAKRLQDLAAATGAVETRGVSQTFHEFVEGVFDELYMPKYRPATRVRYKALLKQGIDLTFGNLRLSDISTGHIASYGASLLKRGVQSRGHINLVRTVLRAAKESGQLDHVPEFPRLPKSGSKVPDPPSTEEVVRTLDLAPGWLRTALALAAYAGLRMGEARAIEVRDIDLVGDRVLVRRAFSETEVLSPKSTHERAVPMFPELRPLLTAAVKDRLPAARLVVNTVGHTPRRQAVLTALRALQEKHKLPQRSFHSFRHYFCTTLVRGGAPVEAVRRLAGHSNIATTQRYVHSNDADLRAAIGKLKGN